MKKSRLLNSFFHKGLLLLTVISLFVCQFSPKNSYAGEMQQDKKLIRGTVVDAKNSAPLPGLTVVVKGTTVGAVTDIDGK